MDLSMTVLQRQETKLWSGRFLLFIYSDQTMITKGTG